MSISVAVILQHACKDTEHVPSVPSYARCAGVLGPGTLNEVEEAVRLWLRPPSLKVSRAPTRRLTRRPTHLATREGR
jgi:hypothetical protein